MRKDSKCLGRCAKAVGYLHTQWLIETLPDACHHLLSSIQEEAGARYAAEASWGVVVGL
jgi:hypothetical protein